jgi:hypothetical protein
MMRRGPLLLGLVIAIAMGAVLGHEIVYDGAVLLRDPRFAAPVDWHRLLAAPYWYQGLWRPVTMLLLGTEVLLAGTASPWLFHTVSLLLYFLVAWLVMVSATTLGSQRAAALAAAAIFAVHPLHVEVVASVVGQAELLVSIALVGATLLWRRAAVRGPTSNMLLGLLALQWIAAGSKEQGYVLPLLLAGQQMLLRPRLPLRTALRWLGMVLLVAMTMWMVRSVVTGSLAGETPAAYFQGISTRERVFAALGVLPRALAMLLVPVRLGFEYGPPAIGLDGRFGWLQAAGIAIIIGWVVAVWWWRNRRPVMAFGLWWAASTWLPASSLIVPAGLLLADRVLFLPTVGLAMALASIDWSLRPAWRRPAAVAGVLTGCLFCIMAVQRVSVWRDADTFFAAMTRDQPRSYRAWYVRALHEKSTGRLADAESHLRQALRLWPRVPPVHEELGQLLRADGRCAEAIPILREGLALDTARFQIRAKLVECERVMGNVPGD